MEKLTSEEIFKKIQLGELVERKANLSREIDCPLCENPVLIDKACLKLHESYSGEGKVRIADATGKINPGTYDVHKNCVYVEGIRKEKINHCLRGILCSYVQDLK